jgi:secreted trypsin-like serine protease
MVKISVIIIAVVILVILLILFTQQSPIDFLFPTIPPILLPPVELPVNIDCGISNVGKTQIIGGSDAWPGKWPWMIYVLSPTAACGGSLISDQWVLTAAHCGLSTETKCVFGSFNRSKIEETNVVMNVIQVIVHPNYNDNTLEDDLALLKLEFPVQKSSHINTICLPSADHDLRNKQLFVAGWGRDASGEPTSVLNDVECQYISFCNLVNHKPLKNICVKYLKRSGVSVCNGDSGGPLMTLVNGKYELVGVISSVATNCVSPTSTTKVWYYLDWIIRQMQA